MSVYQKIDKALKQHEKHGYYERDLFSIEQYLDWANKWHKITKEETNEFIDRILKLQNTNYID